MFILELVLTPELSLPCAHFFFLSLSPLQSAKLRKLPPFLTVSLLRFNFDFARCERYKETGRYTFPLTINLRPFCEQVLDNLHPH